MECNLELFTHVLHIWVFTCSATLYFLPPDFSFRFRLCRFRLFSVDDGTTEPKWNILNLKWFSLAIRHKNTNIDNRKDAYISQVMQMIIQVSPVYLHVQLKIILLVNALKAAAQRRFDCWLIVIGVDIQHFSDYHYLCFCLFLCPVVSK